MKYKKKTSCQFAHAFSDNRVHLQWQGFGWVDCTTRWRVGPRRIPGHLIYYLESGEISGWIEDSAIRIIPGKVFWLQPGTRHSFSLAPGVRECRVFYLRFFFGRKNPWRLKPDWRMYDGDDLIPDLLTDMAQKNPDEDHTRTFLRSALGVIASGLFARGPDSKHAPGGLNRVQMREAVAFIQKNITRRFRIKELSSHLHLNADYFSRRFKESFGVSPREWIKRERIRAAAAYLMESSFTVTEIAYRLGYEDIYFFSRQFKEVKGISPGKWRKSR